MKTNAKRGFMFGLIFLLVIALNYILHLNEDSLWDLKEYGHIGTFLLCFFLNATVLLPSSSTAVVMSYGSSI